MNNHQERIARIRKMAQSGVLTYSDVRKRLAKAIEKEYQNENPDISFINACEDMLWTLETQGHRTFSSTNDRYLEVIHQNTKPQKERTNPMLSMRRLIVCLSVFVIVLCLCGGGIHWHWFSFGTSPDEEQFVIRGESIDISLIAQCIAEHNQEDMIETNDWNVLVSFLGFEPQVINPLALQSSAVDYFAYIEEDIIRIDVNYILDNDEGMISLSLRCYTDINEAYFAFEQDAYGEKKDIDSSTVYTNENQKRCSITWIDGITVYHISGQFSIDDGINLVQKYLRRQ